MFPLNDRRLIAAALFTALPALGGCISSTTYGTGQAPELSIFSEMTGGLAGGKKKEPINYQPRAPLVMPPDGQLQQPIETASAEGGAWPATATADDAVGGRGGDPDNEVIRDDITPEYERRLRPLAGLIPASPDEPSRFGGDSKDRLDRKYETLRNSDQGKQFKADLAEAKGINMTHRRYLTDPPEGYRTPSENSPTNFNEIEKKEGEKKNFFARLWPF